jgi:hypothetical protein
MSCQPEVVEVTFIGRVVSCESRYKTTVERAIVVDAIGANWIVTVDVEEAEAGAPASAGGRISFLFHSPTHLFFASAEELAGRRYRFTIDRMASPDGVRWDRLRAARIE